MAKRECLPNLNFVFLRCILAWLTPPMLSNVAALLLHRIFVASSLGPWAMLETILYLSWLHFNLSMHISAYQCRLRASNGVSGSGVHSHVLYVLADGRHTLHPLGVCGVPKASRGWKLPLGLTALGIKPRSDQDLKAAATCVVCQCQTKFTP